VTERKIEGYTFQHLKLLPFASPSQGKEMNDVHSQLNRTRVGRIIRPETPEALQDAVRMAGRRNRPVSVCAGRHAMGGQQFGTGMILMDMTGLNRVLSFDAQRGLIEVQAGAFWGDLTNAYLEHQRGASVQWGFAQKQTGADKLSLGGTLAANAHGRGLSMQPFIGDIESFTLVNADGDLLSCSREENGELFRLAAGGYGLFGIVSSMVVRLVPRQKVMRVVELRDADGLMAAFAGRIRDGFTYGDFQFAIDPNSDDFLHKGVFSCYCPVDVETPMPETCRELSDKDFRMLAWLAHEDKQLAFRAYQEHYLSTDGQIYWSDTHQLGVYPENYHREINRKQKARHAASEIITEINVPRDTLPSFLAEVREDFRKNKVDLIYGSIRLIEKESDSFLPWARQSYACTLFNLHTVHTPEGIQHSAEAFRRLIDMAVKRGGTYYLTYHRFAHREQVLACYPDFISFLQRKNHYDPAGRFQSDWYRHYRTLFPEVENG
jgi:FAD/FMN-containing dehydrogenase